MFNANNYGYNPYGTYIPQRPIQPMEQSIQQNATNYQQIQPRQTLIGKTVDSIDVVKAADIPMDGTVSYFPIADGSAIATKQLQMDGTSKITVFRPEIATKEETTNDLDEIKEDIKEIKQELKSLKKKKKDDKDEDE